MKTRKVRRRRLGIAKKANPQGLWSSQYKIVWTLCRQCGNTWTTDQVSRRGRCPICGGKSQKQRVMK